MTLSVGDPVSMTSTNNTSSKYGFITRLNEDDTIEVELTIETKMIKLK